MDTVAPRLSRSSTRYGPIGSSAASFSGPVRKWRKAWVPLAGAGGAGSGSVGGVSRDNKVMLFKWTPANGSSGGGGASGGMEPSATRRRYVPAAGEAQNTSKKGSSSELNLNLELEDPDDDTDADLSTEEQHVIDNNPRPESRPKRKAF
ncbi:hypothetical protein EJB05_56399 [Eragrostis curvula]|uniref:Uncharacterized protein n=1 Tax=Eragrostis curvula TaxID=38414 RepID=A0A5J9SHL9_9POAL|nr:hypothetical protein EJB05_56399 [Eragrostis curvula]